MLYAYDVLDDESLYVIEAQLDTENLLVVVSDHGVGRRGYTSGLGMSLIKQAADRVFVTSPEGRGSRVETHFALSA